MRHPKGTGLGKFCIGRESGPKDVKADARRPGSQLPATSCRRPAEHLTLSARSRRLSAKAGVGSRQLVAGSLEIKVKLYTHLVLLSARLGDVV
jgi:hypothetical protein